MNHKTWQTYVLIAMLAVHLSLVSLVWHIVQLVLRPLYREDIEFLYPFMFAQCSLLAVSAAFSECPPWRRYGLFCIGIVYVPLQLILPWIRFLQFTLSDFTNVLRVYFEYFGFLTCLTVACWLPIRYSMEVNDYSKSNQFGMRPLLKTTFIVACLMAWYRTIETNLLSWYTLQIGLRNITALGLAASLLSSKHQWLGVAVTTISLTGFIILEFSDHGFYSHLFECCSIGLIVLTILLVRVAKIPPKPNIVATQSSSH